MSDSSDLKVLLGKLSKEIVNNPQMMNKLKEDFVGCQNLNETEVFSVGFLAGILAGTLLATHTN